MRSFFFAVLMLTLLSSCKSLKSFPPDDHKTSSRWLQMDGGDFGYSGRLVITDKEYVSESYERANWGRQRGTHLLKEQTRLQLSPENSHWFWQYVDRARVLDWTDDDMPTSTNHPSLTYRKGSKAIHLPVSHGTNVKALKFSDLNKHINELVRRTQSASLPTDSEPVR